MTDPSAPPDDAPPPPDPASRARRVARWAALAGALLAVVCHLVPPDYRAVCEALAQVCTAGVAR